MAPRVGGRERRGAGRDGDPHARRPLRPSARVRRSTSGSPEPARRRDRPWKEAIARVAARIRARIRWSSGRRDDDAPGGASPAARPAGDRRHEQPRSPSSSRATTPSASRSWGAARQGGLRPRRRALDACEALSARTFACSGLACSVHPESASSPPRMRVKRLLVQGPRRSSSSRAARSWGARRRSSSAHSPRSRTS